MMSSGQSPISMPEVRFLPGVVAPEFTAGWGEDSDGDGLPDIYEVLVTGTDGVRRRWVYLHYFKEGQPTLNWLDPTFAAQRMIVGDAIHQLSVLGDGGIRLDANGLLGIERDPKSGSVWSEGHPLANTSNQLIGDMVRKLGGFTFQELALAFDNALHFDAAQAAEEVCLHNPAKHIDWHLFDWTTTTDTSVVD